MQTKRPVWIFAYGSLLWRPGFDFHQSVPATLAGWRRRFWQGSPDHRGTASEPGRVVTLLQHPNARCRGIAYELSDKTAERILPMLDVREQGGYVREQLQISLQDGFDVSAITWIAHPDNRNFLGPASSRNMAAHIAVAEGPSGTNLEYFLRLSEVLETLGESESHLSRIRRWLRGKKFSFEQT